MDLSEFINDSFKNIVLKSPAPLSAQVEKCMLGIDEAGRGPVLGPMVYAACYCPFTQIEYFQSKGIADSKTLSEKKRNKLFSLINESSDKIGWILEVHSPSIISNSMYRRLKYNLNSLSQDSAIILIQKALALGINVTEVYVDTVGPPEKYQAMLASRFPGIKIIVEKKADFTHPIVSAASICAKVARDNALKAWKFVEGKEFDNVKYGSGYPGDPATKNFLTNNIDPVFGYPQLVRFSWSTAEKILQSTAVEVEWENIKKNRKSANRLGIKEFMRVIKKSVRQKPYFHLLKNENMVAKPKSHSFFTLRNLHQTVNF